MTYNEQRQLWLERVKELEKTDHIDYTNYYYGYNLLKKLDVTSQIPEIYICTGNRTGGKTFFIKQFLLRYALSYGRRFMIIARKRPQVGIVAKSFFEDLKGVDFFKGCTFEVVKGEMEGVKEIVCNNNSVAYVTYVNYADSIKEASNLFNTVDVILKDEFQARDNTGYCEDEVGKIRSIHKSVSRGYNSPVRFVTLILAGNHLSMINPYFVSLKIHQRYHMGDKFYRGNGVVMQMYHNAHVAEKNKESAFEQAFGSDRLNQSDNENKSLDADLLVCRMNTNKMQYQFTIIRQNKRYGMWCDGKVFYVSRAYNPTHKIRYALDTLSHSGDTIMLKRSDVLLRLKNYYDKGFFRFEDLECQSVCADLFSIVVMY